MRLFRILMIVAMVAFLMPAALMCAQAADQPAPPPANAAGPPPSSLMPLSISARVVCPSGALLIPMKLDVNSGMAFLQLTEDQKPKVADLQKKFDAKMSQLAGFAKMTTKQIVDALAVEGTTLAQLKELAAKANKADADVLEARLGFWLELKGALTADQYKKLVDNAQRRLDGPVAFGPRPGPPDIPPAAAPPAP